MAISRSHNMVFRICGFAVLLVCALWQIVFSYQEQQKFSEKFDKDRAGQSRNVRALTHHARQLYLLQADLDGATALLQRALIVNPSYVPAWLSLAELKNDKGEKEKAYAILQYVDLLTEGLKRWRWEKALTAYQLGKLEMLPDELSHIVKELPGKERNDALQLAYTLWKEPEELLEKMGIGNIAHLLGYAVRKNLPQPALYFWYKMESEGVQWQEKEALALLEMLLRVGEVRVAGEIWRKHFNPDEVFFNGDFSRPMLGQAFGWRTGKKQNFDQQFTKTSEGSPARILHYRFKGWENVNFMQLYQIVPLAGGKTYSLRADMKSQKMTTNQRPFLEVSGYKCQAPVASSEMVAPDQDWTEHRVQVEVPEECAAVVVRLRRKESNHIDNKLAGQLWLRNFVMSESAAASITENISQQ